MFRRIEYSWIDDEWPYDGMWPVYMFAAPPPQMDRMLAAAFALQAYLRQPSKIPARAIKHINTMCLSWGGGIFENYLFMKMHAKGCADQFIRDFHWLEQPTMQPVVGIQHHRIVNGMQNEIRGECLFLYPSPPVEDQKYRKDIDFWQCAELFQQFKSQTKMSSNWKLNLPITDEEIPQTGLVYVMESEKSGRFKIGWTARDAGERLSEIRTANSEVRLIASYSATKQIETMLHKVFADKRVRTNKEAGNEWFDLSAEDLAWIKRILS